MLSIKELQVSVEDKEILRGLNFDVKPGEVHAIMGPNGSGKSTLSATLAGREDYEVTNGSVEFNGKDLLPSTGHGDSLPSPDVPPERGYAGGSRQPLPPLSE